VFAVQFDRFGAPAVLGVGEAPEPHAQPGSVRIRVEAAGVSPVDLSLRAGTSPSSARLPLPHITGVDAAGVIDEIGDGVTGWAIGDEVFGSVDVARLGGAAAEFAVLRLWARRPATMTWAEAGAGGTSIETATRALDSLAAPPGATLLVDGAAGGVGSVMVQLAIARGLRLIGAARPENRDFVAALGAEPVDAGALASLTGVDAVLDAAGAGRLAELVALAGSPDRVVTIADFGAAAHDVHLSLGELGGQPGGRHGLAEAAALSEAGRFRVPVQQSFPFADAATAHEAAQTRPRRGRIALTVR